MNQGPASAYQKYLRNGDLTPDPAQANVVDALQKLYTQLLEARPERTFFWQKKRYALLDGLYIWGGVGRGKTCLMDLFFNSLPFAEKKRQHFHEFMREIHHQLVVQQGHADPLKCVATELAQHIRVLCLDEFHVVDIADAVIMSQLLDGLFNAGIVLVTTSNVQPEKLYNEGIQRASFLPAIRLLEQYTRVIEIVGQHDYRRAWMETVPVYLSSHQKNVHDLLEQEFGHLSPGLPEIEDGQLLVNGRAISCYRRASDVVWFRFDALCHGPRSTADYLEIAESHHAVILESVPVLDGSCDDCARRFIQMVDIFYDCRVKLVMSADAPPEQLYQGERLAFEFQRTSSRLLEMQSSDYLAAAHIVKGHTHE